MYVGVFGFVLLFFREGLALLPSLTLNSWSHLQTHQIYLKCWVPFLSTVFVPVKLLGKVVLWWQIIQKSQHMSLKQAWLVSYSHSSSSWVDKKLHSSYLFCGLVWWSSTVFHGAGHGSRRNRQEHADTLQWCPLLWPTDSLHFSSQFLSQSKRVGGKPRPWERHLSYLVNSTLLPVCWYLRKVWESLWKLCWDQRSPVSEATLFCAYKNHWAFPVVARVPGQQGVWELTTQEKSLRRERQDRGKGGWSGRIPKPCLCLLFFLFSTSVQKVSTAEMLAERPDYIDRAHC
jgi:hypothetical protein